MAAGTRYSSLEYRRTLVVIGTLEPFNGGVPLNKIQDADLVVCVQGNTFRVTKDRYAEQCYISAEQFVDIREGLPNVEILQANNHNSLFARTA